MKPKRLKKILVLLMSAFCLFTSVSASAFATEPQSFIEDSIAPAYEFADYCESTLSVSGTTLTCLSSAVGDNVIRISVTHTLQKYSGWFWIWNDVGNSTWTKTVNDNSIVASNKVYLVSNGKYRLKSVFTLTDSSGETETITIYSSEKKVS